MSISDERVSVLLNQRAKLIITIHKLIVAGSRGNIVPGHPIPRLTQETAWAHTVNEAISMIDSLEEAEG